jgi:beta-lactamase superfamily II metal-dependent hydrolase
MGDLETEPQNQILDKGIDVSADIIKIPHHGSSDSFNEKFLKQVGAKYAVIPVGKDNKFGHPSEKVVNFLNNIKVYRTDQDGDVVFDLTKNDIKPENP